jgi:hypothetical protein
MRDNFNESLYRHFKKRGISLRKTYEIQSAILLCECGTKYIATKLNLNKCMRCTYRPINKDI